MLNDALVVAAYGGHESMVKRLLAKGAQDSSSRSAELLGEQFTGFNTRLLAISGSNRRTPFETIRNFKRERVLTTLNEKPTQRCLGSRDEARQRTLALANALTLAAERKDTWAIKKLDSSETVTFNAMANLVSTGKIDTLSYLKEETGFNNDTHMRSLLKLAVNSGQKDSVLWCINNGANNLQDVLIQEIDKEQPNSHMLGLLASQMNKENLLATPLTHASANENVEVFKVLCEFDTALSPESLSIVLGRNFADKAKQEEMVKHLISAGVPTNVSHLESAMKVRATSGTVQALAMQENEDTRIEQLKIGIKEKDATFSKGLVASLENNKSAQQHLEGEFQKAVEEDQLDDVAFLTQICNSETNNLMLQLAISSSKPSTVALLQNLKEEDILEGLKVAVKMNSSTNMIGSILQKASAEKLDIMSERREEHNGLTLLERAIDTGNINLIGLFAKFSSKETVEDALFFAAQKRDFDAIKTLLSVSGLSEEIVRSALSLVGEDEKTLFEFALNKGDALGIELVGPYVSNKQRGDALVQATKNNDRRVVRALLDSGEIEQKRITEALMLSAGKHTLIRNRLLEKADSETLEAFMSSEIASSPKSEKPTDVLQQLSKRVKEEKTHEEQAVKRKRKNSPLLERYRLVASGGLNAEQVKKGEKLSKSV